MLHASKRVCPLPPPRASHSVPFSSSLLVHQRRTAHSGHYPSRTHDCGALRAKDADRSVVLSGWILPQRRISNSLSFFTLKDSYGTTQLLANSKTSKSSAVLDRLANVPVESVVLIQGSVHLRPSKDQRESDPTGEVEVIVDDFTLLNSADHSVMPFLPSDGQNIANDELRARFRHLDLRRQCLTENLRKRSRVVHAVRDFLHGEDFLEVETPLLLKSTPEGAREFLVPTRLSQQSSTNSPKSIPQFFSLAQSPQQPKQLLICSGAVDKYFQIAKCFRDEDGRKDRQPEFTQVDMEMAFVSWGKTSREDNDGWRIGGIEVRNTIEALIRRVWLAAKGAAESEALPTHFPVMRYVDAMNRYGSDKPDTRFGLEIGDLTPLLPPSLQASIASEGDIIEYFVVRRDDPAFEKAAKDCLVERLDGVEAFHISESNLKTWLGKSSYINTDGSSSTKEDIDVTSISDELRVTPGDYVWISRRRATPEGGSTALGRARLRIGQVAENIGTYVPPSQPHLLWVTEFPLFTRADHDKDFLAKGRWSSSHHPFTAPMSEDINKLMSGDFASVRGQHYDLVLNGVEIGGGSVRVHDPDMQDYIFTHVLQLTDVEKASFGHLLHALRCGAPPHGGIALGLDRLVAMLCNTQTIRDVIAFPKTGAGTDTFFRSPSSVNDEVLAQYGLKAI